MASTSMPADRIALGRIEPLSRQERLVLAAVAQQYLRFEVDPRPVPRPAVARQLRALLPGESWSEDKVDRVLSLVELRSNVRGPAFQLGIPLTPSERKVGNLPAIFERGTGWYNPTACLVWVQYRPRSEWAPTRDERFAVRAELPGDGDACSAAAALAESVAARLPR